MAEAGRIIPIHQGNWTIHTSYEVLDQVYYSGSTYIAKNNIADSATAPSVDTENWVLSARGFEADTLTGITGIDTEGLLGTVGAAAIGQALIDEIADRVATKLIPYDHLVNNGTTTTSGQYALDGAYGKTLADGLTTVNSNLGGKLIVIESTFKTLGSDGKLVTTQLEGGVIESLGITPQNSIIVGWSAHNKVSNTWWSNDAYPSINKVVKSSTYNINVTNLPQNGFSDYYISALSGKNIIGVNVKWTNYNVLMSTITAKDNNIYINTINPYTTTITDTGIATVYYIEDDDYVGVEPINCVVAKLRINLSTSKTMLQVQSHLPSQYDVGDKFRIVIYKFDNVIEITA